MEKSRLDKALGSFRKNLRLGLRAAGIEPVRDRFELPPADIDLFKDIDATPTEIAAYLLHRLTLERTRNAAMSHMAMVGAAVEMGMHEVNSEMSSAQYGIREAMQKLAEKDAGGLRRAISSLERLSSSLTVFNGMSRNDRGGYLEGADILAVIEQEYGRYLKNDKIELEATKAFLKLEIHGRKSELLPAVMNLVRNAWYWCKRTDGPHRIRLDAETMKVQIPWDDGTREETDWIIKVSDSGPGVDRGMEEAIFLPFQSGRGSSGIGLYLTKTHLHQGGLDVVVSPQRSDLGGAEFRIGQRRALEPVERFEVTERELLAIAGRGIAEMIADGRKDDVARLHAETYGALYTEAMKIRIAGANDDLDRELLDVANMIEEALQADLRATPAP